MTFLLVGDGHLAGALLTACQYGGQEPLHLRTTRYLDPAVGADAVLTLEHELAELLRSAQVRAVLDATPPYVDVSVSRAVAATAGQHSLPLARLIPTTLEGTAGAERWTWLSSVGDVGALPVELATPGIAIEPPPPVTALESPRAASLLAAWDSFRGRATERGPGDAAATPLARRARDLLLAHDVDHLIATDSGSVRTLALIAAADEQRLPVFMIERPISARPTAAVPVVSDVLEVFNWLRTSAR